MGDFALDLAREYASVPAVEAVALGGSRTGPFGSESSDYDLYVYSNSPLPITAREEIALRRSPHPETGNRFWEPGDEWTDRGGERVDVMFRGTKWIEEQLARVLDRCEASIGYSTAFWFNVKTSVCLFDRAGWFARLQVKANSPYPAELRRNIIEKNHRILRSTQSSYLYQIEQAILRRDPVSVNHRIAALLASFFDILFALNWQPHPGEKRLLAWAVELCPTRPKRMEKLVTEISSAGKSQETGVLIRHLLDELDVLLRSEKLIASGRG
jgi:hypothetical protein